MADSTVYGPSDNPVPEGPLQRIFEFHGGSESRYAIAKFRIWRRVYSFNAKQINTAGGSGQVEAVDDTVLESLIAYSNAHDWPWDNILNVASTPPFDISPDDAELGNLSGGTLSGVPTLPGVSTFGFGVPTRGNPGVRGSDGNQGAGFEPAFRTVTSPSTAPPTGGSLPDGPSSNGRTGSWGSVVVTIQFHDGGGISVTDPGSDGGSTLAETVINFGGVAWVSPTEKLYEAVAAAVRPRDFSSYSRSEPWIGAITGQKGSNSDEVWILLQRPR